MSIDEHDFSVGKELANFASTFIKNHMRDVEDLAKTTFRMAKNQLLVRLDRTYSQYLESAKERHSNVKTFLFNQNAVPINSFYVPLGVSTFGAEYSDVRISELTASHNFNIIIGTAGSGKSMMMRSLFLDSIDLKEKIPVFLDLRDLNEFEGSLEEAIRNRLKEHKFDLGDEFIEKALELGYFILFLDGFDELAEDKKTPITREIIKMAHELKENQIVVSSRPDYFNHWEQFRIWEITSLTLPKACDVIDKLPFDWDIKWNFIKALKDGLFEEHEYFLSNPLLLTIMWLCYGENAEIPRKYNLFYERAYEALFNKHDARKGGFKRTRKTKLDINEFADVFSAFSIQSFDEDKLDLSESEVLDLLNKAKQITTDKFEAADFREDSINAVCLLVEDGLRTRFSHKSFQEYFAAIFISTRPDEIQRTLFERYLNSRSDTANLLRLAYGIKPESVEQFVLIPGIEKILSEIGYEDDITLEVFAAYVAKFVGHISHARKCIITKPNSETRAFFRLIGLIAESEYPELSEFNSSLEERNRANTPQFAALVEEAGKFFSIEEIVFNRKLLGTVRSATTCYLELLIELRSFLKLKHHIRRESIDEILGLK